jgi:hypothetical protein
VEIAARFEESDSHGHERGLVVEKEDPPPMLPRHAGHARRCGRDLRAAVRSREINPKGSSAVSLD